LSITLPEPLWARVKGRAVDERQAGVQTGRPSLNAIVMAALEEYLAKPVKKAGK